MNKAAQQWLSKCWTPSKDVYSLFDDFWYHLITDHPNLVKHEISKLTTFKHFRNELSTMLSNHNEENKETNPDFDSVTTNFVNNQVKQWLTTHSSTSDLDLYSSFDKFWSHLITISPGFTQDIMSRTIAFTEFSRVFKK